MQRRVTRDLLRDWPLPTLDEANNKEDRGTALIVGGTVELAGAVVLAGTAALRAGAGKLQIATCRSVAPIVGIAVPEALSIGLDETADGSIDPSSASIVARRAKDAEIVLIGPGMESGGNTESLVSRLLPEIDDTKIVLDAGALVSLHDDYDALHRLHGNVVITPHDGEMAALMNTRKENIVRTRSTWALRAAKELQAVVALKGAETLIASPEGDLYVYSGGGVGLATSGSGDTLAGIVSGLLARGASPLQAAVWAVYAHGAAGKALAKKIARVGFLARELLDEVPAALGAI